MSFMSYMDILKLKVVSEEARAEILDELSRELVIAEKGKNGVFRSGKAEDRESVKSEFNSILRSIESNIRSVVQSNAYAEDKGGETQSEISLRGKTIPLDSSADDLKAFALEMVIERIKEDIKETKSAGIMKPMRRDSGPKPFAPAFKDANDKFRDQKVESKISPRTKIEQEINEKIGRGRFSIEGLDGALKSLMKKLEGLQEAFVSSGYKKVDVRGQFLPVLDILEKSSKLLDEKEVSEKDILNLEKELRYALTYEIEIDDFSFTIETEKTLEEEIGVINEALSQLERYSEESFVEEGVPVPTPTVNKLKDFSKLVLSAEQDKFMDLSLLGDTYEKQRNNYSFLKLLSNSDDIHLSYQAKNGTMIRQPNTKYTLHKRKSLSAKERKENSRLMAYDKLGQELHSVLSTKGKRLQAAEEFEKDLEEQGFSFDYEKSQLVHDSPDAVFATVKGNTFKVGATVSENEFSRMIEDYVVGQSLLQKIQSKYKATEGRILDVGEDKKLRNELRRLQERVLADIKREDDERTSRFQNNIFDSKEEEE